VMSLPSESLRDPDAAPRQYAAIREIKKVEQQLALNASERKGYSTMSDTIVVLLADDELDRRPALDRHCVFLWPIQLSAHPEGGGGESKKKAQTVLNFLKFGFPIHSGCVTTPSRAGGVYFALAPR
jgi:hypothetical protein